jgi:aminopeptidase N
MPADQRTATLLSEYKPTPHLIGTVELDVSIDAERALVTSRMTVERNPQSAESGHALVLNGEDLELLSIAIDGRLLNQSEFRYEANLLHISDPPPLPFRLEISSSCNPAANTALSGLYRSNGIYCTQCEAEGYRRIAFGYDRPDAMARYTVRIEAGIAECPVLLSNGNLMESGRLADGARHFAVWHDPHPKPTYLFALVAGDLAAVQDSYVTRSGRKVELGIYVERGKENRCAFAMDSLKASLAWDERRFGREYDLDVFNIVAISDFNMGAMENKGLNIFNDKYILALPETATDQDYVNIEGIIAHEYFHNWTGNRITCRDWFQLCLKEGLTVFRDQEFTADLRSRSVARIADVQTLRIKQFPEDAGPLAHPPRPSSYIEINNFYTPTVYEKGAEICRMLQTLLGEAVFRKGMDLYFERHDGEAATVEQFIACFADVSGRDLGQFFRWYEQAGTPVVRAHTSYDRAAGAFTLTLSQETAPTPGQPDKLPQHIPLRLGLLDEDGNDLPLQLDGAGTLNEPLVELREASRSYRFTGLAQKPVLSLNRSFSAPIRIETDQTPDERLFLMRHDSDSFNRWEAGQTEALRLFVKTVRALESNAQAPDTNAFASALAACLADEELEPALRAQLLAFPTEAMVCAALGSAIDTDVVHKARRRVMADIARRMLPLLERLWSRTEEQAPFQPTAEDSGLRALHYAALSKITLADAQRGQELIANELAKPRHMTAEFGALTAALHLSADQAEAALASFYDRHRDDHLLVDKWFSLMAAIPGSDSPGRIARLMKHPDFRLTTPNRVFALIGSFTSGNMSGFNAADGSGYRIVADTILQLDPVNPQVAARMATAFRSWKLMDNPREQYARAALEGIVVQPNLSPDTFEITSKMLG